MTKLRQKMLEDMQMHGLAEAERSMYRLPGVEKGQPEHDPTRAHGAEEYFRSERILYGKDHEPLFSILDGMRQDADRQF